ncbi:type II toxin-antitoxin system PemK/MazF family toxin [uncultured Clostridium sp.]|uniref:type II toxin-antitoxin system PemK/MazF family toxin n=1 Tax=uncultured Clostridium sp. TaxID=59620 RepID=UPI0026F38B39|nr:type II toxin-antitoxin system PemK/MazF family toxin [uncultured Clostridium sp.]
MRRGDVYYANLGKNKGSVQGGVRPVVIVQNNVGNKFSPTLIVVAITTKSKKNKQPTHVTIEKELSRLQEDSIVLLEQIRTINKKDLREYVMTLSEDKMRDIDKALCVSLALQKYTKEVK